MSIPQTSVTTAPAVGVAGQLVTLKGAADSVKDSGTSEEVAVSVPVGFMVVQGAADHGVLLPAAQADVPVGVALFGHAYARAFGDFAGQIDSDGYTPGTTFEVGAVCDVYVIPTENVAPGDAVRYQAVANGAGHPVGSFRTTADAGKSCDISAFAQWKSTALAGNPAWLRLNAINASLVTND